MGTDDLLALQRTPGPPSATAPSKLLTTAEVGGLTGAQLWLNVRGLRS